MKVKYSELSNDLQKYVASSSHYWVDVDHEGEIRDEWNSEDITEDDIAEQKVYDETGEL
jgi:hypothetical protein